MTEPTPTFDRTATDRPEGNLSPAVREIVAGALPEPDRSLAVELSRMARAVGLEHGNREPTDERGESEESVGADTDPATALVDAVRCFDGYVAIRADLLTDERFTCAGDRDAAVLASDYLHAGAYTHAGAVTDSSRQAASIYRVLTRGSTALARAFHAQSEPVDGPPVDSSTPEAVLAGTASGLGATAAGATDEVRNALERYGRSLLGAIAAHPSPSDAVGEVATLVLSGRPEEATAERNARTSSSSNCRDDTRRTTVRRHVERAREAVATLERSRGDTDGQSATASGPVIRSPLGRLERATRIPFGDVVDDDA